jgi:hypothetical protein
MTHLSAEAHSDAVTSQSCATPSRARRAVTLVELLVGIVIATLVVLMAVSHVIRHQHVYDAVAADIDLRTRLRDASDLIAADLRASSSAGDSIIFASDTAVEFYSAIGSSTVCTSPTATRITLPPDTLASGRVLTSWIATPDTGDYVIIFSDSSSMSPGGWTRARIASLGTTPTLTGCPPAAGLLAAVDVGTARSYEVSAATALPASVRRGSPVRFIRRVRYDVYRGGDGKWYLGYRRCTGGCAAVQPVSGPYESAAGPPVTFRYFTHSGARLAGNGPATDVARVEIVSHANYRRPVHLPGRVAPLVAESATVTVALRNR